jgi:acyl-[acyl-carrier-protein]-phospholipid O-acyltransferase/long-chain-fatty-acid--[acyl-carrier-protein] ligase
MSNAPSLESPAVSLESGSGGLKSASFLGLAFTQLLTAINDNIFRWLVIGIGKDAVDPSQYGNVLMAGTACFVLPYLLLAAPAGYLADRFRKRSVIVGCKVAEVVIMGLGVLAILLGSLVLLFVVVAMMGAQSALFAPAKLGSIPEMLPEKQISAANGIFGLMTVVATLIGMVAGNFLKDATGFLGQERLWMSAATLLGVALVGLLCSLLIRPLRAANPQRSIPWDAPLQTFRDLRMLAANRALFRIALGMVFFWSVGAMGQLNIDQLAYEGGALSEADKVPLLVSLIVGVGLGSVLAGIWSAGRVELGILPLGAGGMALAGVLLFTVPSTIFSDGSLPTLGCIWACLLLLVLGLSAGLFDVPLESYMQFRSPVRQRGSILAASNFMTFGGILLAAGLFSILRLPIQGGSLERVEVLQTLELSPSDQVLLDRLERPYRQAWNMAPPPPPSVESLTDPLSGEVRSAAIARLLWVEFQQRKNRGETLNLDREVDRFPDSARLVRDVFVQSSKLPLLTSRQIFLLVGLLTVPVFVYTVWLVPHATVRFGVWLVSRSMYRIRVHGLDNIPADSGALLAPNHISWLDGLLLLLVCERPIRMVVWAGNFNNRWLKWWANSWGVIMIEPRPKAIIKALRVARDAVNNGELVCIFPEGGITRNGQIQAFRQGIMKIVEGTQAPVVPIYLDELWGSIFSFERGRFFWKWPRRWRYPISIHFGDPIHPVRDVHQIRQAVQELGAAAVEKRMHQQVQLTRDFIRRCKQRKRTAKVVDSLGTSLSGADLLLRSLVLRRILRRDVLAEDEQYVGVLLPPSGGGVVVNAALALDHRISVNLNYTVSAEVLNQCLQQAGIRRILTSRRFHNKLPPSVTGGLQAEIVYLEDFKDKATKTDKLAAALQTYVLPTSLVAMQLGLGRIQPDDVITIIFTSGSTGTPKGVMLTHANVAHNVDAIDQIVQIKPDDVLLGILPFFHSFGYTVTMWGVLGLNIKGVYHFNPLDAKQIGKLCLEHGVTLMLSTPTFLRTFVRRCTKEEFATLDVVVTGAEKLPADLADAFEERFGVRPVEGYGTTELSPLVAVNVPPSRSQDNFQKDRKEGTVGRPVPGVATKVIDLDDGHDLSADQPGMLLVKGANVMKGYLGRDELTAEVIRDGWYTTGDVAVIDEEGFIRITGRESRFSKIGGEMVPHVLIEEQLVRQVSHDDDEPLGGAKLAVTAVPHPKKGERLVVLHTKLDKTPEELCKGLSEAGLPNLYIPSLDSFCEVDALPLLGTGKLDLKHVRQLALERFGGEDEEA